MATTTFTPSMLRGAGTRGIPEIAAGSSYSNTYSLSFDGTDDGVVLGSTINLATTNTISIWVKRDDPSLVEALFGGNTHAANAAIWLSAQNRLYVSVSKWVKPFFYSAGWSNTTDWFHLAVVRDGDGATLYKNGASITTLTGLGSGDTLISSIGYNSLDNSDYFDGELDNAALWDSDQSSNISAIYGGGTPPDLTSLSPVAWYRFNEGSGTTAIDSVGSNNGTISGATYSTDVPT
jgi:hypothetical protein